MTREIALLEWEKEYGEFLNSLGIASLRSVGRFVGVPQATTRKKAELAAWISDIATGKISPAEKSRRGAPIKEDFVDPAVLSRIEELQFSRAVIEAEFPAEEDLPCADVLPTKENSEKDLILHSSEKRGEAYYEKVVYCGELTMLGGSYCIKVVEPKEYFGKKAAISEKKVKDADARTGDRLTFHGNERLGFLIATEVLSVNAVVAGTLASAFERAEAEYPNEKLLPLCSSTGNIDLLKYFTTLYPVAFGQRILIAGAPKSGKSALLRAALSALRATDSSARVVVCLCERPPEEIGEWQREFPTTELYVSGFGDEAETHVSQAEKALERAKSYACDGENAVLFVDDFNALAHAYNETDNSAGGRILEGGLESKTLHYMKKFFGTARKLKSGASLTVIGALSTDTGAPFDHVFGREMLSVSLATWYLRGVFRRSRCATPDCELSDTDGEDKFLSESEREVLVKLFRVGADRLYDDGRERLLRSVVTPQGLLSAIEENDSK